MTPSYLANRAAPRHLRVYLMHVFVIGLLASTIAGVVLSAAITIIYRSSVTTAEDRIALSQAADLLTRAVSSMVSVERPSPSEMAALAMTASHVRALVPDVRGVNIMFRDGTKIFGTGGGHTTQSVPLRDSAGKVFATLGLSVARRNPLDRPTLVFIVFIALTAIVVSAVPQFILARRAIVTIVAQCTAAEDAYIGTLVSLSETLELRDSYTANHSQRVAQYAEATAIQLGLSNDEVRIVREGALLHDLGKVSVPDAILLKNGPLTADERAIIERHPIVGADVLSSNERFCEIRACVLHHHERFDGNGYPDRLCGFEVPASARIVAVADAYDAMTTDRPYRKALTHDTALDRLRAGMGTQWDGACVEALIHALAYRVPEDTERPDIQERVA
jgi:putative nucleotidyltransferase with HDIG domain